MIAILISTNINWRLFFNRSLQVLKFEVFEIEFDYLKKGWSEKLASALDAYYIASVDLVFLDAGHFDALHISHIIRSRTHAPLIVYTPSPLPKAEESELLSLVDGRLRMPWVFEDLQACINKIWREG